MTNRHHNRSRFGFALILVLATSSSSFARQQRVEVDRTAAPALAATVRHAPTLNGRVEGSIRQLTAENVSLNGNSVVTGDLLVPGTPTVRLNGQPNFGGVVTGTGAGTPTNHRVTLNGNASLGHLVTRTDPIPMPAIALPHAPLGSRDIVLNPGQPPGDWATVRNLTLNGNYGVIQVPPGTYGRFVANGTSGFSLGVAGSTQETYYNLTSLTMNGQTRIEVVGPVRLTLGSSLSANGMTGSSANPLWLNLDIASGGVTLNGSAAINATVRAPNGTVTLNGNATLNGSVVSDRLVVNGGGTIIGSGESNLPVVTLFSPKPGAVTSLTHTRVAGIVEDESRTTVTVNEVTAQIIGTTYHADIPLPVEGANSILVTATDAYGNMGTATGLITRDTSRPRIEIDGPDDGEIFGAGSVEVTGSVEYLRDVNVQVNGVAAIRDERFFSATVELFQEGNNALTVTADDGFGASSEATVIVVRDTTPPSVNVEFPSEGEFVTSFGIYGTASDVALYRATVNGERATLNSDGTFGGFRPAVEGLQTLTVAVEDRAGNVTEVTRSVTVDLTPPVISGISPVSGTEVDGTTATVRGHVVDSSPTTVRVGKGPAAIEVDVGSDGTFAATNVPIHEQDNIIPIEAEDAAGNLSSTAVILIGAPPGRRSLSEPPRVFSVTSPTRLPYQEVVGLASPGSIVSISGGQSPVTASVVSSTGLFVATVPLAQGSNSFSIVATRDGMSSPEAQVQIVSDPSLGLPSAGTASLINVALGDNQRGLPLTELARPLIAIVTDRDGHPVASSGVSFAVLTGGGTFVDGSQSADVTTDEFGYAAVRYIVGNTTEAQLIRATFSGNANSPITFAADVVLPTGDGATAVSGVVYDAYMRGLPNVLVRLGGQETRTGADGRFRLAHVLSGPHQILELIGRDQISLPGRWPNISYDIDVLSGVDNHLGRPLFLPRVNDGVPLPLDSSGFVTQDTTVELPVIGGLPSILVTARAGTRVTFPPDVTDRRLSVTHIPFDRVPMALDDGRATNLYISVQPSGAVFDPPLDVSFPNLDGQPPGAPVLLMSFDHDAGRYVQVGTGHVSADGSRVSADPNSGIHVGAWHAFPPPPPRPPRCVTGETDKCTTEVWVGGVRAAYIGATPGGDIIYRACFDGPDCSGVATKLAANDCAVLTSMQATAVPGPCRVTSIAFEQGDGPLDANPVPNGGGRRIFPDALVPGGPPQRQVRVRVRIAPAPASPEEEQTVYFKAFDVDDAGGLFDEGNDGGDNLNSVARPTDPVPNTGSFSANNCLGNPVTVAGPNASVRTQNGEACVVFNVTMQPGDNFRIAASLDSAHLEALRVDGRRIEDVRGNEIPSVATGARPPNAVATEMLTVWRRLHVEVDNMANPPEPTDAATDTHAQRTYLKGTIVRVDGSRSAAREFETQVDTTNLGFGYTGLDDGSPCDNCPDRYSESAEGRGRFENGTLVIGTGVNAVTIERVERNGLTSIRRNDAEIPFLLVDSAGANPIPANADTRVSVTALETSTRQIRLSTNVRNGALYANGTLTIAGHRFTIREVDGHTVTVVEDPTLPFTITDDDTATSPFVTGADPFSLMQDSDDSGLNLYATSFIRPVYDRPTGVAAFTRNQRIQDNTLEVGLGNPNQDAQSSDDFWVVYFLGSFQGSAWIPIEGSLNGDSDPLDEVTTVGTRSRTALLGFTSAKETGEGADAVFTDVGGSAVYSETLIDFERSVPATLPYRCRRIVVVHESGHQFALRHRPRGTPAGIMGPCAEDTVLRFIDDHLRQMRKRPHPQGL